MPVPLTQFSLATSRCSRVRVSVCQVCVWNLLAQLLKHQSVSYLVCLSFFEDTTPKSLQGAYINFEILKSRKSQPDKHLVKNISRHSEIPYLRPQPQIGYLEQDTLGAPGVPKEWKVEG